ncbi:MAG: M15 family metallopeptidase [Xanthobacteraceae bacterium]
MSRTCVLRLGGAMSWAERAAFLLSAVIVGGDAVAQTALPAGFVYLRDVDPTILQDIRYATSDNFVGRPIAGYEAAECILKREVAAALKRVQADLHNSRLGLKVYDCYRPERSVRAMMQWARDGRADAVQKRFFPRLEKHALFALGYLAASSRHSAGTAVDVTLIELSRGGAAVFDRTARYGPCTAPAAHRSPDNSVDMGTGYDCLDITSHTASAAVGAEQQRWRALLVAVMRKHGFGNYYREWWHFSYAGAGPSWHYDFPVKPR